MRLKTSLAVLSGLCMTATLAQAALPGFYLKGQIGRADTHARAAVRNFEPIAKHGASTDQLDNSGLAGRVAVGWRPDPNHALELGWLQTGKGCLPVERGGETGKVCLKQHAVDLLAKYDLPVSRTVSATGGVGFAWLKTNLDFQGVNITDQDKASNTKWLPKFELGFRMDVTPKIALEAGWSHLHNFNRSAGTLPNNVDFLSVGAGYSFG